MGCVPSQTLKTEMRSVGRHSLIYMLGPAFSKIVGFLLIPIYTRFIAPTEFGVMSLVDVFMTITMMFLAMGVGESMSRFYFETEDEGQRRRLVSTVIFGNGMISLPIIVLIVFLAGRFYPLLGISLEYVNYLRLGLVAAWLSMLAEVGFVYLRMRYLSKLFVGITVFQILSSVLLNLMFVVVWQKGIWGILYSTLIVQGCVSVLLTTLVVWQTHARPSWIQLRRLLSFGLPLVPSVVTLQLSNYLNPLLIRWMLIGDPAAVLAQVGLFAAGQKIGVVVNRFVTVPFNAFWRPRRMELVMQDNPEVRRILARICTYATLMSAQVAVLLSVSVENLLQLVVNERYWDAYRVVPLIAAAYVVLGLEHHFSVGMFYARKTMWATWIGLLSLLIMVLVNLALLPSMGILAAALASCVGISVRVGLVLIVSQRYYPIKFELRRLAGLAVWCSLLFGASCFIQFESVPLTLAARLACGGTLLPLLWMSGFFWPEECDAAREFVANRWLRPGVLRQSPVDLEP